MITKLVANQCIYYQYGGILYIDFHIYLVIKYICVIQTLYIRTIIKIIWHVQEEDQAEGARGLIKTAVIIA